MRPRTYFQALWNTFSSAGYYVEVLKAPVWFSIRFVFMTYALLAVIAGGWYWQVTLPTLRSGLSDTLSTAQSQFPDDLAISWNGDGVTMSQKTLQIPFPESVQRESMPKYILTIDPSIEKPASDSELANETLLIIGKSQIFVQNQAEEWQPTPLKDVPGFESAFTIDKASSGWWKDRVDETAQAFLSMTVWVFPLLWFLLKLVSRSISALFDVTLLWALMRIFGQKPSHLKLWQLLLHCMVVAEVAEFITSRAWPNLDFPMFSAVLWAFLAIVLWKVGTSSLLFAENDAGKDADKKMKK